MTCGPRIVQTCRNQHVDIQQRLQARTITWMTLTIIEGSGPAYSFKIEHHSCRQIK